MQVSVLCRRGMQLLWRATEGRQGSWRQRRIGSGGRSMPALVTGVRSLERHSSSMPGVPASRAGQSSQHASHNPKCAINCSICNSGRQMSL
jgi:hypothetical protein